MVFNPVAPLVQGRTWRGLTHLGLDWLIAAVTLSLVATLLVATVGTIPTIIVAIPMAWTFFWVAAGLGRMERSRAYALLDVDIEPAHAPPVASSWLARLWERAKSGSRWREIAYLLLILPLLAIPATVVVALWSGALALAALPFYVSALPGREAHFGVFSISQGPGAAGAAAVGVVALVFVLPWLTLAVAALDRKAVVRFLGARPSSLRARVRQLEVSRGAALDSAAAERRRIERDLHDGAQQRLVALAMDLGRAREQFEQDPERARQLVAEAHEEAKSALAELRDLVRGIHPAVLEDRGLDAALSAVVARSPVPIALDVRVAERPPQTVEAAVYFVVSEALTNVARHSHAQHAHVAVIRDGNRLVVDVSDDGVGGADRPFSRESRLEVAATPARRRQPLVRSGCSPACGRGLDGPPGSARAGLTCPSIAPRTADAGTDPPGSTTRVAYDLTVRGFGPGAVGPITVVAETEHAAPSAPSELTAALRHTPGVVSVATPQLNSSATAAVVQVTPAWGPADRHTAALISELRHITLPGVDRANGLSTYVGGETAANTDFASLTTQRLPLLILGVLTISFLLLLLGFGSVSVAAQAIVLNLLSVGAAYGIVVAVFQWGWGAGLLGASPAPVAPWIPTLLFAITFGLSMDYEVFVISAIRDARSRNRDATAAVASGLGSTAGVITAAAVIMALVFGSFVTSNNLDLKVIGIGLAAAIVVDASLIRLLIVPAVMTLLGPRAWWCPVWLQRLLHRRSPGPAYAPANSSRSGERNIPASGHLGDGAPGVALRDPSDLGV